MTYKLNKQVSDLERIVEKIEERIDQLTESRDNIFDWADVHDRSMTDREHQIYVKYDEKIDLLEDQLDDIMNALDYLKDYCE